MSAQACDSWASAALSWALLGTSNGEDVDAGIRPAGRAPGRAQFPTLSKVNPFCRELFKQAQELKAKKLESYLLWKDAAPALCSRSCKDCLLAARAQGLPTFPLLCQDPQVRCPTGHALAPLQASLASPARGWLKCGGVPPGALLLRAHPPAPQQRRGRWALASGLRRLGPRPSGQRPPGNGRGALSALCGEGPGRKAPLSVGLG